MAIWSTYRVIDIPGIGDQLSLEYAHRRDTCHSQAPEDPEKTLFWKVPEQRIENGLLLFSLCAAALCIKDTRSPAINRFVLL